MAHQGATLVGATLVAFLVPLLALLTFYHWLLPLLFKMDVETFLPVTDFPQSRFSMVIILVPALICIFFLRLLFLYLRWRLNQANAHYKNFSFNVLFGVGAFAGAHLLLLAGHTLKVQLLGTYLLVTSFRLFYQSLLVAAVHVCRNSFNNGNNRKLRFGFVYRWNEPFVRPLVFLCGFLMILVLPVLEFSYREFTSSPPSPEVTAPKKLSAHYFHLTLLANLVLAVLYGVALVKLNRWWTLVVKAAFEYLMLLAAQLILLNSISLLVTSLVWPLWKICLSAYPCCGMRLVVHRRCRCRRGNGGNGRFLNNNRRRLGVDNRGGRGDFEATGTAAATVTTTAPQSDASKEHKEEVEMRTVSSSSSSSATCRPFPEAQVNIENFVVPAAAASAAGKASEASETSDIEMETTTTTTKEPELEQRTGLITKEEVGGAEGKQGAKEVDYLQLLSAKVAQVQRQVQDFIVLWEWKLSGNEDEEEVQRPTAV